MMVVKMVCLQICSSRYQTHDVFLEDLKDELENYIRRFNGLVKLYRTGKRAGLIAARTLGAEKSTGDVIIVLDAHCECVR